MLEWIQFALAAALMLSSLIVLCLAVFGVFRFRYVMNRMHAAALIDTLGALFMIASLIVANGLNLLSLKLMLVVVLLWSTSPVSSHLIARLEITTCEEPEKHMEVKRP